MGDGVARRKCATLSIADRTFREWIQDKRKQQDEETKRLVYEEWMRFKTQEEIAEAAQIAIGTVNERIGQSPQNGVAAKSEISANFTPEFYALWNFGKAPNEVRHFGNIPPENIDNRLHYFTEPFGVSSA